MTINNGREDALAQVMELTDGLGADVAFEAVGVPQTFELATELIRPGGRVANIGVHGEPVTLHLETLWIRDVTVTTGLVDTYTIPRLMKLVASGRLDPTIFATHRYPLGDTMAAYDTFADAASTGALKVVLEGSARDPSANGRSPRASWPGPHDPAHPRQGTATSTRGGAGDRRAARGSRLYARPVPLEEVEVTSLRPERFAEVLTADAMAAFERAMARGHAAGSRRSGTSTRRPSGAASPRCCAR